MGKLRHKICMKLAYWLGRRFGLKIGEVLSDDDEEPSPSIRANSAGVRRHRTARKKPGKAR